MKLNEKLQKIASEKKSGWVEKTKQDFENKGARANARKVALRVLGILKQQGISQTELAERMQVSRQQVTKIVKGKENFTFETIDKLERALGVTIMTISSSDDLVESTSEVFTTKVTLSWDELQENAQPLYFPSLRAFGICQFERVPVFLQNWGKLESNRIWNIMSIRKSVKSQEGSSSHLMLNNTPFISWIQTDVDATKKIAESRMSDYCTS